MIYKVVWIFFLFLSSFRIAAQEKESVGPNEFTVSVNSSLVEDEATENRTGFGFGVFHYFEPKPFLNMIFGIEFNKVSQFKYNYFTGGHSGIYNDVTFSTYFLSTRFISRFTWGKPVKFFFDPGIQLDLPVAGEYEGTYNSWSPNGQTSSKKSDGYGMGLNINACFGLGILKSFKKFGMYLKPEYKIGLTKEEEFVYFRNRYLYLTLGLRLNRS